MHKQNFLGKSEEHCGFFLGSIRGKSEVHRVAPMVPLAPRKGPGNFPVHSEQKIAQVPGFSGEQPLQSCVQNWVANLPLKD